jgi:hypothetical protein
MIADPDGTSDEIPSPLPAGFWIMQRIASGRAASHPHDRQWSLTRSSAITSRRLECMIVPECMITACSL